MNKISWLHLTDLHRGMTAQGWLWPNVEQQFFRDMAVLHEKSGPWDFLIFSGDLVQTGAAKEFQRLDYTLKRIYEKINSLGSDPVLLSVPGNHDLRRPSKDDAAFKKLLRFHKDKAVRDEFWNEANSPMRKAIKTSFASFSSWNRRHTFPKPLKLKSGILPGDFTATVERRGLRIGVLGLNTAFLQLASGDCQGQLDLSLNQLIGVCGPDFVDWFTSHSFCLLVTHHPPDWLTSDAQRQLYSDIAIPGRFLVHHCGHLHESRFVSSAIGGSDQRRCYQGASLFGLEKYNEISDRRHGYSVCSVEVGKQNTGTIRMWPRSAVKHQAGHWHFVEDNSATLDEGGSIKPESITVTSVRSPVAVDERQTFSVVVLATDRDLEGVRKDIADHLRRSLGVAVDEGSVLADDREYDVMVLLQGWWWDGGRTARDWQKNDKSYHLAFIVDEGADWPPFKLAEIAAQKEIREFRRSLTNAVTFTGTQQLPDSVSKSVTELMQAANGQIQIGLKEWERTYLQFRLPAWISGRTTQSKPHLFDAEQAEELYQPELYVGLDGTSTEWERGRDGYPRKMKAKTKKDRLHTTSRIRRVKLARWLVLPEMPRVVLVGAPGGGKTIFLTRIAASLGSNSLGRKVEFEQDLNVNNVRTNLGLLIPIVVEATRIASHGGDFGATTLIEAIKQETACGSQSASSSDVEAGLVQGRYLLLIDALDEIADSRTRSQVLTLLKGIAVVYPRVRVVVTTRSARYTGDLRFGPEFETVEVAGLDNAQVRDLCANWAIARKRDDDYKATLLAAAEGLAEKVGGSSDDQSITENPLMLTAVCMVFERYRSLPDDRGRLCELLVDDLCRSRRSEDLGRGWKLDEVAKKDLLQRIALGMQEQGAQSWGVDQAIQIALQLVPSTENAQSVRAKKYVDWAADHTGILRFHEGVGQGEQIRFWHRIFREYLAASRIAQLDTTAGEKVTNLWNTGRLKDPFWEDVVRLLPRTLGTIEKAKSVLETLERLAETALENRGRLIGLAAAGIIENRDLYPEVRFAEMAARMGELYEAEGYSWRLLDRLLFLESLGRLDPKDGDPRLKREQWVLASQRNRSPASALFDTLVAAMPVTVLEFCSFLDSSKFEDPKFWKGLAPGVNVQRRSLRERLQPQKRHPNWPVVSVGIGEAIAYCRWRTEQRQDNKIVRLPTRSELQSLTQSLRTRSGWTRNAVDALGEPLMNWAGAGIGHPTPVGAFPVHASGLFDILGNVWEWVIATHAATKSKLGNFFVFGASYALDPGHWDLDRLMIDVPTEFEYIGEMSIGFRCVLAEYDVMISSTDFSRR
jgi:hypothetical protein